MILITNITEINLKRILLKKKCSCEYNLSNLRNKVYFCLFEKYSEHK